MRKARPKSIYPDENLWNQVRLIADQTDNVPARVAVRLIRSGVRRYQRKQQRTRTLQPA